MTSDHLLHLTSRMLSLYSGAKSVILNTKGTWKCQCSRSRIQRLEFSSYNVSYFRLKNDLEIISRKCQCSRWILNMFEFLSLTSWFLVWVLRDSCRKMKKSTIFLNQLSRLIAAPYWWVWESLNSNNSNEQYGGSVIRLAVSRGKHIIHDTGRSVKFRIFFDFTSVKVSVDLHSQNAWK